MIWHGIALHRILQEVNFESLGATYRAVHTYIQGEHLGILFLGDPEMHACTSRHTTVVQQ